MEIRAAHDLPGFGGRAAQRRHQDAVSSRIVASTTTISTRVKAWMSRCFIEFTFPAHLAGRSARIPPRPYCEARTSKSRPSMSKSLGCARSQRAIQRASPNRLFQAEVIRSRSWVSTRPLRLMSACTSALGAHRSLAGRSRRRATSATGRKSDEGRRSSPRPARYSGRRGSGRHRKSSRCRGYRRAEDSWRFAEIDLAESTSGWAARSSRSKGVPVQMPPALGCLPARLWTSPMSVVP